MWNRNKEGTGQRSKRIMGTSRRNCKRKKRKRRKK
jgi:hypothetical protein